MIRLLGENNSPHFQAIYIICSFEGAASSISASACLESSCSQSVSASHSLSHFCSLAHSVHTQILNYQHTPGRRAARNNSLAEVDGWRHQKLHISIWLFVATAAAAANTWKEKKRRNWLIIRATPARKRIRDAFDRSLTGTAQKSAHTMLPLALCVKIHCCF